jgi:hypothetical protein
MGIADSTIWRKARRGKDSVTVCGLSETRSGKSTMIRKKSIIRYHAKERYYEGIGIICWNEIGQQSIRAERT